MAIEFECPSCGGVLNVADDYAGRTIRCGACLAALVVPGAPPAPAGPFDGPAPARRPRQPDPAPPAPNPFEVPTDDAPRARRRPRPVEEPDDPRPGRGLFFWLIVTGAAAALLGACCCGGLWLVMPGAEWGEHESAPGRFRAEFPGPVQPGVADALNIDPGPGATEVGAVLGRKLKVFVVIYRDVPPNERQAPDQLDRTVAEAKRWLEATAVANATDLKVNGFPARDFTVRSETKGRYVVRAVAAGDRVYVALAGGVLARANDPDAKRFRDSFTVLPKGKDE